MDIIRYEPALITGMLQAVLALLSATVITLTPVESGAILAATTAILALVAAVRTTPFQVSALTGFVSAIVTLLIAFGVPHVNSGDIALVNAVVVAVSALLVRAHVTPKSATARAAAARVAAAVPATAPAAPAATSAAAPAAPPTGETPAGPPAG